MCRKRMLQRKSPETKTSTKGEETEEGKRKEDQRQGRQGR